jgi:ferrous iron transport protein B
MSIIIWALAYFPRSEQVATDARATFVAAAAAANAADAAAIEATLDAGGDAAAELQAELDQHTAQAYIEQSYLARFGKAVAPVFAPAGYDWRIATGVIASFPAREVIIATLGILYGVGEDVDEGSDSLREKMAGATWTSGARAGTPVFTIPVALSIMVFFALCMQCGATVATIVREANWRWALLTFVYMTTLAWLGAVVTYQVAGAISG